LQHSFQELKQSVINSYYSLDQGTNFSHSSQCCHSIVQWELSAVGILGKKKHVHLSNNSLSKITPIDVKELEFISALMQTSNGLRVKGSIEASDIVMYLCSRHGLTVDECNVQDLILRQLAGPTTQVEKPVLDLCQLVALLLIPKFLEACQDKDLSQKMLQPFITTLQSFQDGQGKLSRDALREMFASYDEVVTDEELLDDMIASIDDSLLHALSSDVGIYDLSWKNHYTTHFDDAAAVEKDSAETAPNHAVPFQRFFTASFI
jgi:hypothetical protein